MSRNVFFIIVFALISLQMFLSLFQVKRYKNEMNRMRGTGIVGIGHTKGGLKLGQIILLSYNRHEDKVVACKVMRGITIFAKFKDKDKGKLIGQSLSVVKNQALAEDLKEFKNRRKKHPYDPEEYTKKKGALIQAIEAIEGRMAMEDDKDQHRIDMHTAAMKNAQAHRRTRELAEKQVV